MRRPWLTLPFLATTAAGESSPDRWLRRCRRSRRRVDARGLHLVGDMPLEALEILLEALGELARSVVIGGPIGPGLARIEHLGRYARASLRHMEAEERIALGGDTLEF